MRNVKFERNIVQNQRLKSHRRRSQIIGSDGHNGHPDLPGARRRRRFLMSRGGRGTLRRRRTRSRRWRHVLRRRRRRGIIWEWGWGVASVVYPDVNLHSGFAVAGKAADEVEVGALPLYHEGIVAGGVGGDGRWCCMRCNSCGSPSSHYGIHCCT